MATHKLLTQELRDRLPGLYTTDETPMAEKLALAKYFTPWSNWTWYALEFDTEDTFFGYVDGFEREFGYFSLSELDSARGPGGLRIERDLYFAPRKLVELYPSLLDKEEAVQ
jgi:hypothetical protein